MKDMKLTRLVEKDLEVLGMSIFQFDDYFATFDYEEIVESFGYK